MFMKKILLVILSIFEIYTLKSQANCQMKLDSIYVDTAASDCNHLFFKYDVSGGTPTKFFWTYGDGSSCNCIHPKHTYNANGNFQVCGWIEDANGCRDSLCITVNINCANPCDLSEIGIYSADTLSYTCSEFEFITITSSNAKKIRWDFGDGDSSDSKYVIHDYKSNGVYDVVLVIQDSIGCSDTVKIQLEVDCPEEEDCDFRFTGLDTSTGTDGITKHFKVYTNRPYKSLWWLYGDNVAEYGDSTMSHIYSAEALYTCCIIGEDSLECKDTICIDVDVRFPDVTIDRFDKVSNRMSYDSENEILEFIVIQDCGFTVFDVNGKLVLNGQLKSGDNKIDLKAIDTGLFIVVLNTETDFGVYKLLKP